MRASGGGGRLFTALVIASTPANMNTDSFLTCTIFMQIPYDYCSVMHYGPYSFSMYQISRPTMLTKDPNYQFTIGRPNDRKSLSFYDAKIINLMYKCNEKCPENPRCKVIRLLMLIVYVWENAIVEPRAIKGYLCK